MRRASVVRSYGQKVRCNRCTGTASYRRWHRPFFTHGLSLDLPSSLEELVLTQFGDWASGFIIDGVLLLIINSVILIHERRRVISQVASSSNEFALDAVRRCRDEGWLQSGKMNGMRFAGARIGVVTLPIREIEIRG